MTAFNPAVARGRGVTWRPLSRGEVLQDLPYIGPFLGPRAKVSGTNRCHAIGLTLGDCTQRNVEGSKYCYYHAKLERGDIETVQVTDSHGKAAEAPPSNVYPVFPFPSEGYALIGREEVEAA